MKRQKHVFLEKHDCWSPCISVSFSSSSSGNSRRGCLCVFNSPNVLSLFKRFGMVHPAASCSSRFGDARFCDVSSCSSSTSDFDFTAGPHHCWAMSHEQIPWQSLANPPAPRRGATRLRRISSILNISPPFAMDSYYSLDFFVFSHFGCSEGSVSHFSCLMSHISCLMSHGLFNYCPPIRPIATHPQGAQDPGWPQNHHENSSIFEPVSTATKAMKIGPKATQNHEKSTLESREIQFLRKLFFATLPLPRARFCNPRHPNWSTKQAKWQPWATSSGIKEPAGQRAIQPIRTQSLKAMRTYITQGL